MTICYYMHIGVQLCMCMHGIVLFHFYYSMMVVYMLHTIAESSKRYCSPRDSIFFCGDPMLSTWTSVTNIENDAEFPLGPYCCDHRHLNQCGGLSMGIEVSTHLYMHAIEMGGRFMICCHGTIQYHIVATCDKTCDAGHVWVDSLIISNTRNVDFNNQTFTQSDNCHHISDHLLLTIYP